MPRIFGWFKDPGELVSCVKAVRFAAAVSVVLPKPGGQVLVLGPITHDLAPYPFLDIQHHIVRLGLSRRWAQKYAGVLLHGGLMICLDAQTPEVGDELKGFDVRDLRWVQVRSHPKISTLSPVISTH